MNTSVVDIWKLESLVHKLLRENYLRTTEIEQLQLQSEAQTEILDMQTEVLTRHQKLLKELQHPMNGGGPG